MSLGISTKLINDAKGKSLKECLETEYQLALNDEMPVRWLKAQKRI